MSRLVIYRELFILWWPSVIFRPQNSYCVHVDSKADWQFRRTVGRLLACYRARYPASNIFQAASRTSCHP